MGGCQAGRPHGGVRLTLAGGSAAFWATLSTGPAGPAASPCLEVVLGQEDQQGLGPQAVNGGRLYMWLQGAVAGEEQAGHRQGQGGAQIWGRNRQAGRRPWSKRGRCLASSRRCMAAGTWACSSSSRYRSEHSFCARLAVRCRSFITAARSATSGPGSGGGAAASKAGSWAGLGRAATCAWGSGAGLLLAAAAATAASSWRCTTTSA